MKYFFSSDYHFNHANIIRYENRPFKDVQEMNETIIRKHNERVKPEDTLFFMGDWGFYASKNAEHRGEGMPIRVDKLKSQMNGAIISVSGNHDKRSNKLNTPVKEMILNKGGMYIKLVHKVQDKDGNLVVSLHDGVSYFPLIICGHVHSRWQTRELQDENGLYSLALNVSVETNSYYPYSFDEIISVYWRWLNAHPKKKEIQKLIQKSNHRKDYRSK